MITHIIIEEAKSTALEDYREFPTNFSENYGGWRAKGTKENAIRL